MTFSKILYIFTVMKKELRTLLQRPDIWQASATSQPKPGISSGHAELDRLLHLNGWPKGEITEIISGNTGIGELQLLLPTLAKLNNQNRWITLIAPPHLPYLASWQQAGISSSRLLLIFPKNHHDALWAAEQCLKSKTCSSLLFWLADKTVADKNLRKLQLASQQGDCWTVLFRPGTTKHSISPAALQLALSSVNTKLQVHILKQKGGWGGQCLNLPGNSIFAEKQITIPNLPVFTPTTQKPPGTSGTTNLPGKIAISFDAPAPQIKRL
jgi:cell division inhibitor SulA